MRPLHEIHGRWGRPERPVQLSAAALSFLSSHLGSADQRPWTGPEATELPPIRLQEEELTSLREQLTRGTLRLDDTIRKQHLGGCSLQDYVARRDGVVDAAADAVVQPAAAEEIVTILRWCTQQGVAAVPFGGGTSVVGGVRPLPGGHRAVLAIDLSRLNTVLVIDEDNHTVQVEPGVTGPDLERLLEARGFTWGHFPQSWERASIGGYLATRSAGQASSGYGRSDDTVLALQVATPKGMITAGRGPSSAAGPDLRQLLVGSEGVFGIITAATLRIRRLPSYTRYEGLMLPSYQAGIAAFQEITQRGLAAAVMRLSDPAETRTTLVMSGPDGPLGKALDRYLRVRGVAGGCLVVLGWEEHDKKVGRARRDAAWQVLRRHGAVGLGAGVGASWRRHRFEGPYLRDALLDRGYIVETLETATSWTRLQQLHDDLTVAITESLQPRSAEAGSGSAAGCYVMSHVSHVYETGASLYLTVLAAAEADRGAQWQRAKDAASAVIVESAATITHHHAVGTDHRRWMADEIGPLGVDVLRAVKASLDPGGVLNPGKLIP